MAFKKDTFTQTAAENPAVHFKTLTKRQYPDVMPHQKEMLEEYATNFVDSPDVALQLPTGSGKTLVGLLIADWRRIRFGDRAVFLCPTRQLVKQTVSQARIKYGIDALDLSGRKIDYSPADRAAYMTGAQVAVSTYSSLFNTHPFFESPDLIIVDDAHASENYIASMWSMSITSGTNLHTALAEFFRPHISPQEHSRLIGDWKGTEDTSWVEKLASPFVAKMASELIPVIDVYAQREAPEFYFPWSILRDRLGSCHVYLSSREILIRPLISPTFSHRPFVGARQRLFMSATLGGGGDLERLTGRKHIDRLAAPRGFQRTGVGRRFFIFPTLSLPDEETTSLRTSLQKRASRSVVLTPTIVQADEHSKTVQSNLGGFKVFNKDDIESDKTSFVTANNAVAILANRYDGIDFPGDECRLLCIDGLPKAMNAQERFIMSKMGAPALYNERIQTRVMQAVGRCTRALQDRSAVFVTGTELVDFLTDDRNWQYFLPELQAELLFGVEQSKDVDTSTVFENFDHFLKNDADWIAADGNIRSAIERFQQSDHPGMGELAKVVKHEICYQEAVWNEDHARALVEAKTVLAGLTHPSLCGYRALWHYLAGSAALKLSRKSGDAQDIAALEHFKNAKSAAPSVSWLNELTRSFGVKDIVESEAHSSETLKQIEALEFFFLRLGVATNYKFERRASEIHLLISEESTFESGLVELGKMLGFCAGNDESDGAPDPWWLGDKIGVVFEANVGASQQTIFGATKARQASSHPKWIKKNIPGTTEMEISAVAITPCSSVREGAIPHLDSVRYWELKAFRQWATRVIGVMRDLKGTFPGEGDLVWRSEASQRLISESLTMNLILSSLPIASTVMQVVGKSDKRQGQE